VEGLARALVVVGAAWWLAAPARADATVEVQVRDGAGEPADGDVTLESLEGERVAGCTTTKGRCSLGSVPGGSYRVRVTPRAGGAPRPKRVMVPPEGAVSLIVSTER